MRVLDAAMYRRMRMRYKWPLMVLMAYTIHTCCMLLFQDSNMDGSVGGSVGGSVDGIHHVMVPQVKVTRASCAALLSGDRSQVEHSKAMDNLSRRLIVRKHEDDLQEALRHSCTDFRRKRQYMMSAASDEERDFPLAFSILTYNNPRQTERLLRAIYRPHNFYCIHVDSTASKLVHDTMASIAACLDNVVMSSWSVDVRWGQYSVLLADLVCMRDLIQLSPRWRYFINLTGKEFPLRTNAQLVSILKVYNGANEVNAKIAK